MKPWIIILIVVAVLALIMLGLYLLGKKLEKKQSEQQAMLEANKQRGISMLIIDKKRIKPKDASLPASVIDQIPKASRNIKMPMVKVKIGPQILTMFCDEQIFDLIPVKKEVKADISGIYIMSVKGVHGTVIKKEEKKKSKFKQLVEKAQVKAGAKSIK